MRDVMSTTESIQKKYMQGGCDAMAIALATHFEAKIVAIHPVHVKKDGMRRTDPDILHALVELPDGRHIDVRGIRTISEMLNDLSGIVDLISLEDDVHIEFEERTYDTPHEFVEYANVDPSYSVQAYKDARAILGDLLADEQADLVMDEIMTLSSIAEDKSDFAHRF
jgi:hypothetical protein